MSLYIYEIFMIHQRSLSSKREYSENNHALLATSKLSLRGIPPADLTLVITFIMTYIIQKRYTVEKHEY